MTDAPGGMKFVSPMGVRRTVDRNVTDRLRSMEGKTIGFLDNHKFSVKEFFGFVELPLLDALKANGVIYRQKPNTSEGAPFLDAMSKECQAAVVAIGD
jgi:hypothetical protein